MQLKIYLILCLYLLDNDPVRLDYSKMKIISHDEYDKVIKNDEDFAFEQGDRIAQINIEK